MRSCVLILSLLVSYTVLAQRIEDRSIIRDKTRYLTPSEFCQKLPKLYPSEKVAKPTDILVEVQRLNNDDMQLSRKVERLVCGVEEYYLNDDRTEAAGTRRILNFTRVVSLTIKENWQVLGGSIDANRVALDLMTKAYQIALNQALNTPKASLRAAIELARHFNSDSRPFSANTRLSMFLLQESIEHVGNEIGLTPWVRDLVVSLDRLVEVFGVSRKTHGLKAWSDCNRAFEAEAVNILQFLERVR